MALVYFDSSAFVKLVLREDESELARDLWYGADACISSRLAYAEVRAALASALRAKRIDRRGLTLAKVAWEELWVRTRKVEAKPAVVTFAAELTDQYSLRAIDAIHLSSALAIGHGAVIVASWDGRLRAAANEAGLFAAPARRR